MKRYINQQAHGAIRRRRRCNKEWIVGWEGPNKDYFVRLEKTNLPSDTWLERELERLAALDWQSEALTKKDRVDAQLEFRILLDKFSPIKQTEDLVLVDDVLRTEKTVLYQDPDKVCCYQYRYMEYEPRMDGEDIRAYVVDFRKIEE